MVDGPTIPGRNGAFGDGFPLQMPLSVIDKRRDDAGQVGGPVDSDIPFEHERRSGAGSPRQKGSNTHGQVLQSGMKEHIWRLDFWAKEPRPHHPNHMVGGGQM